mmetsp:Transcript_2743/g.4902  ORF Transcript_2743/g.4902 Transcript_2743/m.4902 type:complete len:369 (-) Transcript_2743:306-1412(-)
MMMMMRGEGKQRWWAPQLGTRRGGPPPPPRGEPHLTPAAILQDPTTSIPLTLQSPSSPQHSRPAAPPPTPTSSPPLPRSSLHPFPLPGLLLFPLLFLATLRISGERQSWRSALAMALLGAVAEYGARYALPSAQLILQHRLLARCPELAGRFGTTPGSFSFTDSALARQYLSYWHRCVTLYDRLILGAFTLKLFAYSYKLRSAWLLTWSSPALTLLLSRCIVRQRARQQELANLALGAYSWLCFWLGSVTELSMELPPWSDGLSLKTCLTSAASVAFLSLQYATVYPYRMEQRKWASLLSCAAAFAGLQTRTLLSLVCQEGGAVLCVVHSLAYAVLPVFFGYIGTELGCTLVENTRIQRFAATLKKTA